MIFPKFLLHNYLQVMFSIRTSYTLGDPIFCHNKARPLSINNISIQTIPMIFLILWCNSRWPKYGLYSWYWCFCHMYWCFLYMMGKSHSADTAVQQLDIILVPIRHYTQKQPDYKCAPPRQVCKSLWHLPESWMIKPHTDCDTEHPHAHQIFSIKYSPQQYSELANDLLVHCTFQMHISLIVLPLCFQSWIMHSHFQCSFICHT